MIRHCLYLCCWLLLLPHISRANHVIGGDLSMQLLQNKPGYYRLQAYQYWETDNVNSGNADAVMRVMIFRKRNPVLVRTYELDYRGKTPLVYDNAACSTQKNLATTKALYYAEYQFDLSLYTDPGGYYMVWERCCRNNAMVNLSTAFDLGMMLYLEFPALSRNGVSVTNSSPVFSNPNGDYVCVNRPFTYDLSATDADGDELRYRLVTPYQGYTTADQTQPTTTPRDSYPLVPWQTGFNAQNAIPGSPPLRIDAQTGQLTLRANRVGVFLFSVQVDEYRNGVYIGQTRRDFQFPVVDCATDRPPVAVISLDSAAVALVNWCTGNPRSLTLTVENRPEWAYQWQKDGDNLPGQTSPQLFITEAGDYTVVKSFAKRCAGDTLSTAVRVQRTSPPSVKLTLTGPVPACAGDTVLLTGSLDPAQADPTARYQWQRDGQTLTRAKTSRLQVSQTGLYKVLVRPRTYTCDGQDSIRIALNPAPVVTLLADKPRFCLGDSVLLTATNIANNQYQWTLDGLPIPAAAPRPNLRVGQGGTYRVIVTAPGGCSTISSSVSLTSVTAAGVVLDSIPPSCPSGPGFILTGSPAGGIFSGPGVRGNQFDPAQVGPGLYRITYRITAPSVCQGEQTRPALVRPGPGLRVPPAYSVAPDDTVRLVATVTQPRVRFAWTPPLYLDDPASSRPLARPAETITYRLTATDETGCRDTARVVVSISTRLYIPTAFTPNGDGINDVWDIKNLTALPNSQVTVYNRWGEVIFSSLGYAQPWDGRNPGGQLVSGLFAYRIKTGKDQVEYRGQLAVFQ